MKEYSENLNLSFDPFEPGGAVKEFFAGGNRQELLDQLIEHSLYSQSLMVVTGCLGCGKTSLATTLCRSFGDEAVSAMVPATLFMNASQFLEKLSDQLQLDLDTANRDSAIATLKDYAAQLDLEAKSLLVVIDDAHELSSEILNLVTSLRLNLDVGIHLVLFGESQLLSMLQNSLSEDDGNSLVDFEISELGGEETVEYVKFKLAEAGYTGELPISGSELGNVHNSANGIPGTINALVSTALENAETRLPINSALPSFVSIGGRYWSVAAVLVIMLVAALVLFEPDPRLEAQQSVAVAPDGSRDVEIPVGADVNARTNSTAPPPSPLEVNEQLMEQEQESLTESELASENRAQESQEQAPIEEPIQAPIASNEAQLAANESSELENEVPAESTIVDAQETPSITLAATETSIEISEFEKSLLEFPGSSYTVQIMGSHSETNVKRFVEEELATIERGYFETRFDDKPWFVVVVGQFDTRSDANKAIEDLPDSLQSLQPWIRTLADIQSDIREVNSIN